MDRFALKCYFYVFLLFLFILLNLPQTASANAEASIFNAISTPEGRAMVKREVGLWSEDERRIFESNLKTGIEKSLVPQLPMQINKNITWNSIRISNNQLFLTVEVSGEFSEQPDLAGDYLSYFGNYICTTPVNVLLMLLGYSISTSFYNSEGSFMESKVFSETSCAL